MNITKEFSRFREDASNEIRLKRYLIDCLAKYKPFRSNGNLEKATKLMKAHMRQNIKYRELRRMDYLLEADAFGLDHVRRGEVSRWPKLRDHEKYDLLKVRITKRLTHKEALEYLSDLAYFIDYVFCFVVDFVTYNPRDDYASFLCPMLFEKYFRQNA